MTALATPAFAHHPDLTGEVVCATDGQQVVTWTVTNSERVDGTNKTMTVAEVTVSSGTVSPISVGTSFPPQPGAGSTQTSTTKLPGTQTGEVTLTVWGDWEGVPRNEDSVSVTLPGTCTAVATTTTTEAPVIVAAEVTTTTTAAPVTTTTTLPAEVLGVVLVAPAAVPPVAELPRTGR